LTDAVDRMRALVEADAAAVRQRLTDDSGQILAELDRASCQLRQQLQDLDDLAIRCSDVNIIINCFSVTQLNPLTPTVAI